MFSELRPNEKWKLGMDQKFSLSQFGEKFQNQTGIGQLMEDLGNAKPGVAMLGGGSPALIPEVEEVWRKILSDFSRNKTWDSILGKYESPSGKQETLESVAEVLRTQLGLKVDPDEIAITNGSQSAFYLLLNFFSGQFPDGSFRKVFLPVVPEYIGYLDQPIAPDVFFALPGKIQDTSEDTFRYELDTEALYAWKEEGPRLGCVLLSRPTNPTGRVSSEEELKVLLRFAKDRKIPFLLDNAYGLPFPGILYENNELFHSEGMIQGFSLSKIGLPGVRTGFILGDRETVSALNKANAVLNLASGNLGQYIALEFLRSGEWARLSGDIVRPYYTRKRNLMLETIRREWKGVLSYSVHRSEGAFFLWVRFPGIKKKISDLYPILKEEGVIIVPGKYFFPTGMSKDSLGEECVRISFAREDEEIERGIRKIGQVLSRYF